MQRIRVELAMADAPMPDAITQGAIEKAVERQADLQLVEAGESGRPADIIVRHTRISEHRTLEAGGRVVALDSGPDCVGVYVMRRDCDITTVDELPGLIRQLTGHSWMRRILRRIRSRRRER